MISGTSPALRRFQCRFLSQSLYKRNENTEFLKSFVQVPVAKPVQSKRILILKPDEVKDKIVTGLLKTKKEKARNEFTKSNLSFGLERYTVGSIITDSEVVKDTNVSETIEKLKPGANGSITSSTASSISMEMTKGFSKAQLQKYISEYSVRSPPKSYSKAKLSDYIMKEIWHIQVKENSNLENIESISLSEVEMFYLLSQKGQLLHILRGTVSDLTLDTEKLELTLKGTEKQLANAKINLSSQFASAYEEEADLSTIKQLYHEKFDQSSIETIGKTNDVFIKHVKDDIYRLCSLKVNHVKRMKRLLTWYLNYNLHQKNFLHLPPLIDLKKCSLNQDLDPFSSSWIDRKKSQFRLMDDTIIPQASTRLKEEWDKYSLLDVTNLDPDCNPEDPIRAKAPIADETYDLLEKLGFVKEDIFKGDAEQNVKQDRGSKTQEADIFSSSEETSYSNESSTESILLKEERDSLYSELCDFSYRESLKGVSDSDLDLPIFTLTFGKTLFEKQNSELELMQTLPEADSLHKAYTFNTNVPRVYDQTLSRSVIEDNFDTQKNPHQNFLQFKFLPSPYTSTGETKLHDTMKYPPIELWAILDHNSIADIETLQVVSVEAENNAYVCLPKFSCDVKLTAQMTGKVLNGSSISEETESTEALEILEATADKFSRLSSQPGIQEFLNKLKFNFSSNEKTTIAPSMKVMINGEEVEYLFLSLRHRTELTLQIEDNKTVQVSIIDGGLLSGRRIEVRLIGDTSTGLSRENFENLVDHCSGLITAL